MEKKKWYHHHPRSNLIAGQKTAGHSLVWSFFGMAHLQNWGCPIFLQRHADLYSFQLLQSLANLLCLFVFQIRSRSVLDQLAVSIFFLVGIAMWGWESFPLHCKSTIYPFFFILLFWAGLWRSFSDTKASLVLSACRHATPLLHFDPNCKLWHLEPDGGQVWPIYRTVSNVPVWIFQALTCFKSKAFPLKGFKRWQRFCASLPYLLSILTSSRLGGHIAVAKVAALGRTIVNKAD